MITQGGWPAAMMYEGMSLGAIRYRCVGAYASHYRLRTKPREE
jgi:hypothetical protein